MRLAVGEISSEYLERRIFSFSGIAADPGHGRRFFPVGRRRFGGLFNLQQVLTHPYHFSDNAVFNRFSRFEPSKLNLTFHSIRWHRVHVFRVEYFDSFYRTPTVRITQGINTFRPDFAGVSIHRDNCAVWNYRRHAVVIHANGNEIARFAAKFLLR